MVAAATAILKDIDLSNTFLDRLCPAIETGQLRYDRLVCHQILTASLYRPFYKGGRGGLFSEQERKCSKQSK
jgi:hypothetical protein